MLEVGQPLALGVLKLHLLATAGFLECLSGEIRGIKWDGDFSRQPQSTLKLTVLSPLALGTFGRDREESGQPTAAGSAFPLSTTTISSLLVPWWCFWPSSCTFCASTEFTADKPEPRLLWTCCGSSKWCRWLGSRWGREAGAEVENLPFLRIAAAAAADWIPPLSRTGLRCCFGLRISTYSLWFLFGAQDGTSSQKSQFNFEELNVERLVLSLAQMKHASPLSQKFDLFLGCSIPPPPPAPCWSKFLIGQPEAWLKSAWIDCYKARDIPASAVAPVFSVTERSLCGRPTALNRDLRSLRFSGPDFKATKTIQLPCLLDKPLWMCSEIHPPPPRSVSDFVI